MKFTYVGRNVDITEGLKSAVESKMEKFQKHFDSDKEIKIVMSVQKNIQKIEVTIFFHDIIIRAEESSHNMYAAIDLIVDKLERMLRKQKTKLQKNENKSIKFNLLAPSFSKDCESEEPYSEIVKRKTIDVKLMSEEEALLQIELLNHDFYLYKDEQGVAKVIYRRKDNQYGIIESA